MWWCQLLSWCWEQCCVLSSSALNHCNQKLSLLVSVEKSALPPQCTQIQKFHWLLWLEVSGFVSVGAGGPLLIALYLAFTMAAQKTLCPISGEIWADGRTAAETTEMVRGWSTWFWQHWSCSASFRGREGLRVPRFCLPLPSMCSQRWSSQTF